ncbi:unnamed protein product [Discula destructiva]
MSQHYPPPPGVDSRRSNAPPRYGQPPAPPSYRPPPPPAFGAAPLPPRPPPPPPAQHSNRSNNHDSYSSNRFANRDRDRGRDDRAGAWNRDDRFARNDRDTRSDRYQPSRRNDNYQPPSRPQDSYRDSRGAGDSFRPPQGDFTFRADKPSGVGDPSNNYRDSYRPSDQNKSRAPPRFPQAAGRGRGGGAGRPYARRGTWRPFRPSERALLQNNTGGLTTEDFADEEHGPTYKALDQLSDSDEADMDISDSDNPSGEPTAKRARTTTKPDDGDSAPKWSNPDPYTALPPLEDADKKKKDMVQMIRKARVDTPGARTSLAAPGADQDFLRFDSESDGPDDDSEEFIDPLTYDRGPASAPVGASDPQSAASASSSKSGTSGPGQMAPQTTAQNAVNGLGKEQKIVIDLTHSPTKAVVARRPVPQVDLTQTSDLGTRKRTHDDVLVPPAHSHLKPGPKYPAGPNVARDWRANERDPRCPWVKETTSQAHINIRQATTPQAVLRHSACC